MVLSMLNNFSKATLAVLVMLLMSSCGLQVPADPEGTLDRISGGTLRVGISHNPPWTEIHNGEDPAGSEAELVRQFAATRGATIEWTAAGEESLMGQLDRGELDLVIGGLTKKSPWTDKAALTQPYAEGPAPDGGKEKYVMAARMGENAFLQELEKFLLDRKEQG
jgi:polar amino acid transport system substrate-binding protein